MKIYEKVGSNPKVKNMLLDMYLFFSNFIMTSQ